MKTIIIENTDPRLELLQVYSDFHKDAYGYRPRYDYHNYTLAELEADFDRFRHQCKINRERELIEQKQAQIDFEARISSTISLGAKNRKTALRWIIQADNVDPWDIEFWVWKQGLLHTKYGDKLYQQVLDIIKGLK